MEMDEKIPSSLNEEALNSPVKQGSLSHKRMLFMIISTVIIAILVGCLVYYFSKVGQLDNSKEVRPETLTKNSLPSQLAGDYDVVVKESPKIKTQSDIYLKNKTSGQETFFITLADVYVGHYHVAEYHNGNLYITTRTGGDLGYENNPNWTDTLWRYNQQKQGQKLYSTKGLDFRVSPDEMYIAITNEKSLILLNNQGSVLKIIDENELKTDPGDPSIPNLFKWAPGGLWLDNTAGPTLVSLAKVDLTTYKITIYDLSKLPTGSEYDLNPTKGLIAISNYPALFDVDGANEYEKSGKKVNLIVYDLKTKTQQLISSSVTKKFQPVWKNNNTLEYNNPDGDGRLIISF